MSKRIQKVSAKNRKTADKNVNMSKKSHKQYHICFDSTLSCSSVSWRQSLTLHSAFRPRNCWWNSSGITLVAHRCCRSLNFGTEILSLWFINVRTPGETECMADCIFDHRTAYFKFSRGLGLCNSTNTLPSQTVIVNIGATLRRHNGSLDLAPVEKPFIYHGDNCVRLWVSSSRTNESWPLAWLPRQYVSWQSVRYLHWHICMPRQ